MSGTPTSRSLLNAESKSLSPASTPASASKSEPLAIMQQGSFAVGGSIKEVPGEFDPTNPVNSGGQTLRGDHAHVFYQIPPEPRPLPVVMWHGGGQSSRTWQTTPDGREGFQNLLIRKGFSTYLVDQPRRGTAGRSLQDFSVNSTADEQLWFNQCRLGLWPDYYENVAFDRSTEALDQFFRMITPNTGPFDMEVITSAISALFSKIGAGILITHSQSGGLGWQTAMKNSNIRGIVSFEPGSNFPFPESETPEPIPSAAGPLTAIPIPIEKFLGLTKIPIVLYYGDNIPNEPCPIAGRDFWRVRMIMARKWVDTVNKYGGNASIVHLPDIGIVGNTHFPFLDLNNIIIADLVFDFLSERGLAG